MKFLATQVTFFLNQQETKQNIKALVKYLIFLAVTVIVFSILFHFIMVYEGREFSWVTGFYWTLTVMSTLGFGDITFESDLGRAFSMLVLLSGIILLLIMLPFAFIRFFYAPWLEAQIHTQAPRQIDADTKDHVIICHYDNVAEHLIKRLIHNNIEYYVIEPDSAKATKLHHEGISVIYGDLDSRTTYARLFAQNARLVFVNSVDTTNTNITLTVREIAPNTPIAAVANNIDSIDILEYSGANHVLPLKKQLGEQLANRISVGKEKTKIIGKLDDWMVIEFPVFGSKMQGKKLKETTIRKETGVNVISVWQRGHLERATPETRFADFCVPVAVGTREQIAKLDDYLDRQHQKPHNAVLILGGGKVGRAAARALKKKDLKVFMVDMKKAMKKKIGDVPDKYVVGDAADCDVLYEAGLNEATLIILSTNDDAVNIYLSIYCRRLKPEIRIVSRITHTRNIEAIHRAGADFVLSHAPLGAEYVMSILQGREPVIMGEGVEFFSVKLPKSLVGKTLEESKIGSLSGLTVLAVRSDNEFIPNPLPTTVLPRKSTINVLGTNQQLDKFKEIFG